MSQQEPSKPYVYQPFGSVTHKSHAAAGRLWGVGGLSILATVQGLTKDEARAVATVLAADAPAPSEGD